MRNIVAILQKKLLQKIKIGVSAKSYLEKRNFIDLPYSISIDFVKKYDLHKPYNHLLYKLFHKINPDAHFKFHDHFLNKNIDAFHFFGSIYFGKKPWFVTSSVVLPRWTKHRERAYRELLKENCKKIFMLSNISYQRQVYEFEKNNISKDSYDKKLTILHPSQKMVVKEYAEKKLPEKIRFIIAGHRILGKGGYEILKVFIDLYKKYKDIELIVISKLHTADYLRNEETEKRLAEVKKMIEENKNTFITYYPELPNAQVIELMKNSHVALLPSYDDTYGYTVLEAQACGCPIITTDIMAFPEINNNEIGWIIEVPKTTFGRPDAFSLQSYHLFSRILIENLEVIIKNIIENPAQIKTKGAMALKKIYEKHNPEKNALILQETYQSIFK